MNAPATLPLPDDPKWFYVAERRTLCCQSNDYTALKAAAITLAQENERVCTLHKGLMKEADERYDLLFHDHQYMLRRAESAEAELSAAKVYQKRWEWAKPILSGDDDILATSRALELGAGLMRNETPEIVIDNAVSALEKKI